MNYYQIINVLPYINDIDTLRKFIRVNKKCKEIVENSGINVVPISKMSVKDCEMIKKVKTVRYYLSDIFDIQKFMKFENPNTNLIVTFDQYIFLHSYNFTNMYFRPESVRTIVFNIDSELVIENHHQSIEMNDAYANQLFKAYIMYSCIRKSIKSFESFIEFLILSADRNIVEHIRTEMNAMNKIELNQMIIGLRNKYLSNINLGLLPIVFIDDAMLILFDIIYTKTGLYSVIKKDVNVVLLINHKLHKPDKELLNQIINSDYKVYTVEENKKYFTVNARNFKKIFERLETNTDKEIQKYTTISEVVKNEIVSQTTQIVDYYTSRELYLIIDNSRVQEVILPQIFGDIRLTNISNYLIYDFRNLKILDENNKEIIFTKNTLN